jgi:ABC-type microcin C transport system permease subunit YejE
MWKTGRRGFILLFLFLVLFVIGINAGEIAAVWEKAANICLDCIGIG